MSITLLFVLSSEAQYYLDINSAGSLEDFKFLLAFSYYF